MARDAELSSDLSTLRTAWDEVHVFAECMCSRSAEMDRQPQTYRLTWQGIEIEARYWPLKWGAAHLEIASVHPERAPLPITDSGYRSHFHQPGTIEALGGDVVAQVIAWLDEEATSPAWRKHIESSRQGTLFD